MRSRLDGTTVAVTGANGFVGGAVVPALLRAGAQVRALAGPGGRPVTDLPGEVTVFRGEITDSELLRSMLERVEVVVHAAGPASVAASFDSVADYMRVHAVGTACVLEACRQTGVRRVVHISSAEVYGDPPWAPVTEQHPVHARSPYGAAKIAAEQLVHAHVHAGHGGAAILRLFSVYGPHLHRDSLLGTMLSQASRDEMRLRDLRPVRDYCYVGDVADAVVRACASHDPRLVVNVGAGQATSVAELAAHVMRALGRQLPVVQASDDARPRDAEILYLIADRRRALETLGWNPVTSLQRGIEATALWMQSSNESW